MMLRFLFDCRVNRRRLPRCPQRAVSIAETLITMAVLGIVLSLAGQITVHSFRCSRQSLTGQQCWRDAAAVNDLMARELRRCEAVVWPVFSDWQEGREITAAKGKNLLLACRFASAEQKNGVLIGYRYMGGKGLLERCVYPDSYKFSSSSLTSNKGILSRKILLHGVTGFSFWSSPAKNCCGRSMMGFSFKVMPIPQNKSYSQAYAQCGMSLCTEVRVRRLQ